MSRREDFIDKLVTPPSGDGGALSTVTDAVTAEGCCLGAIVGLSVDALKIDERLYTKKSTEEGFLKKQESTRLFASVSFRRNLPKKMIFSQYKSAVFSLLFFCFGLVESRALKRVSRKPRMSKQSAYDTIMKLEKEKLLLESENANLTQKLETAYNIVSNLQSKVNNVEANLYSLAPPRSNYSNAIDLLKEAMEIGHNETARKECDYEESFEYSTDYRYDSSLSQFTCVKTVKSRARIFFDIDLNGDRNVTKDELRSFFNSQTCKFPFTFKNYAGGGVRTYYNCTTDSDEMGFAWCSIKTDETGKHVTGYYKYCDETQQDIYLNMMFSTYDKNSDELVSFDEIENRNTPYRRELIAQVMANSPSDCGEESVSVECKNYYQSYLMNQTKVEPPNGCNTLFKTKALNDEELLRLLADAMFDSYRNIPSTNVNYFNTPTMRTGSWLSHLKSSGYMNSSKYDNEKIRIMLTVSCLAFQKLGTNYDVLVSSLPDIVAVPVFMLQLAVGSVLSLASCPSIYKTIYSELNSTNVVMWSLYRINKGRHQNKTILAYMGTSMNDPYMNLKQIVLDLYAVPYNDRYILNDYISKAVKVAETLKPDFITGHSLGGFVAEAVCSELGIPGASFAALGGIIPGNIERSAIQSTRHNGVPFEVVVNKNDIATMVGTDRGFQCNHIAKSSDVRVLDFPSDAVMGHSALIYSMMPTNYYSKNFSKSPLEYKNTTFLQGVQKNNVCDYCRDESYCASGYCHITTGRTDGVCADFSKAQETSCPTPNPLGNVFRTKYGDNTPCQTNSHCKSNKCLKYPNGYFCSDTCKRDEDCKSGRCEYYSGSAFTFNALYTCRSKLAKGEWCNENDDCESSQCSWFWKCL